MWSGTCGGWINDWLVVVGLQLPDVCFLKSTIVIKNESLIVKKDNRDQPTTNREEPLQSPQSLYTFLILLVWQVCCHVSLIKRSIQYSHTFYRDPERHCKA